MVDMKNTLGRMAHPSFFLASTTAIVGALSMTQLHRGMGGTAPQPTNRLGGAETQPSFALCEAPEIATDFSNEIDGVDAVIHILYETLAKRTERHPFSYCTRAGSHGQSHTGPGKYAAAWPVTRTGC
jgi:hypothetical protein